MLTTFVVNWGVRDFWEPDSETLTSDMRDNQLGSGIQSKSIRGLGAVPLVEGVGGGASLTYIFF